MIGIFITAVITATAFVAVIMLRDHEVLSDTQIAVLGLVVMIFGAVMFYKCGGLWCSLR